MPSPTLTKHLRTRRTVHGLTREEMSVLCDYMTGRTSPDALSDHEAKMVLTEMTVNSTDELKRRIVRHKEGK